jgi:hypothetical protein
MGKKEVRLCPSDEEQEEEVLRVCKKISSAISEEEEYL